MVFPKMRLLNSISIIFLLMFLINCGGGDQSQQSQPPSGAAAQQTSLEKGDVVKGKEFYMTSCVACHGPDATGVKGLGKDLTNNEFIKSRTDEQLLKYVLEGRMPDHPLNTTGIAMPPKGGNPALTEKQIVDIIAYMRTLQN